MFGFKFCTFVAVIVCLGNSDVYATITKEQMAAIKEAMEPLILECVEELSIPAEQVEALKNRDDDVEIDPCFMSCFFKKTEIMSSDGVYDAEKAMELTKTIITDEDDLAIIKKIKTECAKVNDEEVTDGEKGCERAMMLFKCFKEHKDDVEHEA